MSRKQKNAEGKEVPTDTEAFGCHTLKPATTKPAPKKAAPAAQSEGDN